ncbi:hypothetical protein NQZ68_026392 [Dissostichus eleginoides]|nr:hypothetical protein NQZ68_026392 [Dissostichus eleginoides]
MEFNRSYGLIPSNLVGSMEFNRSYNLLPSNLVGRSCKGNRPGNLAILESLGFCINRRTCVSSLEEQHRPDSAAAPWLLRAESLHCSGVCQQCSQGRHGLAIGRVGT